MVARELGRRLRALPDTVRRQAAVLFGVAVVLLVGSGAISLRSIADLRRDATWVAHTHQVRAALTSLLGEMIKAESAQRGYLLTGDETHLAPFWSAESAMRAQFETLRRLVADNPEQALAVRTLQPMVDHRLALLGRALLVQARGERAGPRLRLMIGEGAVVSRRVEGAVRQMLALEEGLLGEREARARRSARISMLAATLGAALAVLLAAVGFVALRRELQQREETEEELRETEARFRRLSDASTDGVAIIVDGHVREVNAAFCELFRVSDREAVGAPLATFTTEAELPRMEARVAERREGDFETVGRRADGSTFPLLVSARHFEYAGRPARVSILRDLSALREANRMKNEFVSTVSHELRTPLTSIRGSLGLIENGVTGALPPKAADLVRIARSNADRLIRLVNDILDVEKIEAGRLELRRELIDLGSLAESAREAVHGMAQQQEVRLALAVDPTLRVEGDRDRLVQVLVNLLSNAVKFSPTGDIVYLTAEGMGSEVVLAVEDHGPGIPTEHRDRLFTKFAQIDQSDRRRTGGTGLGLVITRAIVQQHGGEVEVESEPNRRTVFRVRLPRAAAESGAAHDAAGPAPTAEAAASEAAAAVDVVADGPAARDDAVTPGAAPAPGAYLLLVEDDADCAAALAPLVESEGWRLVRVASVAAAERALAAEPPAAVLLDPGLPDGHGLDLVDRLRERWPTHEIPVIVVSGRAGDGMFGYPLLVDWLMKPWDELRLRRALRHARRVPGPARALVVDDDADARAVIAARLRGLGAECAQAADGASALRLARTAAFDVVILDVDMPRVDGYEFVRQMRDEHHRSIPLVVYSGRDLDARDRARLTLGMTRHLTKARATEEQFAAAVRELLGGLAA